MDREPQPEDIAAYEQALVDLAQWLGRVMQYSASHPSCAALAGKAHEKLMRALGPSPLVSFGVLRDNLVVGETPATHPAIRTRFAPHLHERGVIVVRVLHGLPEAELRAFMELLTLPVRAVFDQGGLARMMQQRGISRVQIEELAHEISDDERAATRRRQRLGSFFSDTLRQVLARRTTTVPTGDNILELLEHPEVAVAILEDRGAGIADAAAGMAMLVRDEEARTGELLVPKLREVLAALAPATRDRLLLGFPQLVFEFRDALAWAMQGFSEAELARFTFPSFRGHADELDVVLYALGVLLPHDGTRFSMLRRVGLLVHDLPADDAIAAEVLTGLARPVDAFESFRRERECIVPAARSALGVRVLATMPEGKAAARGELGAEGAARVIGEVVSLASRTRQFDRFCRRLPAVDRALAAGGTSGGSLALVRALADVTKEEKREVASAALRAIVESRAPELLRDLDGATGAGAVAPSVAETVRLVVAHAPLASLEHLERCESPALHKLLLESLTLSGAAMRPLVRAKLASGSVAIVRDALALLPRVDGRPEDLAVVARHPDEAVRLDVARALRAMPPGEAAVELAVRYLTDPSLGVRQAAKALVRGELLTTSAVTDVEAVAGDVAQPEDIRRRMIAVLGRSSHDVAAQALHRLLQPRGLLDAGAEAELRELVAATLHHSVAPAAAGYFQEGLRSTVRRVRKACERAAGTGG